MEVFIGDLRILLQGHSDRLAALDKKKADESDRDVRAGVCSATGALEARSNKGAALEPGDGAEWSGPWTWYQVGGWARGLIRKSNRVTYVYGARGSGKSRLIAALRRRLQAESPPCQILHLNVRDLVAGFRSSQCRRAAHEAILTELLRQIAPGEPARRLGEVYDFDAEMFRVLHHAQDGPIYLIIGNSDACLRQPDPQFRQASIDATKNLFSFLRPMAEESAVPPIDRTSVVLEGSRPLVDLALTYPASPLNVGTSYILGRLNAPECSALGRRAGIHDDDDLRRLHAETGGHRSLVWAILKVVAADEPGKPLPTDLASLPTVQRVIGDLQAELDLQPELARAFDRMLAGEHIDLESRTRLQHAMFIADSDPPSCGCSLLEARARTAPEPPCLAP
jgi:energy-coupling factor transporter ATP-binding protein EcfA2